MSDRPEWFAPRRFGLGTGMPISWQGWLLAIAFGAVVVGASLNWPDKPLVLLAVIAPTVIIFMVIAAWTTRGGWRWRWGDRD